MFQIRTSSALVDSSTNTNTLRIEGHEYLIHSIKHVLSTVKRDKEKEKEKDTVVEMSCHAVFSLDEFIKNQKKKKKKNKNEPHINVFYDQTLSMLSTLTKQIEHLIKKHHVTFYEYNVANIVVILVSQSSKPMFIYISNDFLPLNQKNKVTFTQPFAKDREPCAKDIEPCAKDREPCAKDIEPCAKDIEPCAKGEYNNHFFSPEINQITQLPQEVHYKTIYYSLGMLCLYFIEESQPQEQEKQEQTWQSIQYTKLYYLLQRMIDSTPERRSILYI